MISRMSQNIYLKKFLTTNLAWPFTNHLPCQISIIAVLYGYWQEINRLIELEIHDDVIKWKHLPRYWPFVRGIHRSPVNSPHKGQWRGALMLSLICLWRNGWVNNREAGDLRRYHAQYDVIVMFQNMLCVLSWMITNQVIMVCYTRVHLLELRSWLLRLMAIEVYKKNRHTTFVMHLF